LYRSERLPVLTSGCLRALSKRGVSTLILALSACAIHGQQPASQLDPQPALPDSPGQTLENQQPQSPGPQDGQHPEEPQSVIYVAKAAYLTTGAKPPPCRRSLWRHTPLPQNIDDSSPSPALLCVNILDPYARFLDTRFSIPMTPAQKGFLAIHDLADPFNFATIVGVSGISIAVDSHTAYGPGLKGFGKLSGVSLLQDATGEFFGTFAIPSLFHQDPHYHRMPTAHFPRRLLHAISRTIIAQSDDGVSIPNYATLLTNPIAAEISNLYVPGIQGNGRSTALRILTGYALDPVNNIVTEFLPDVAKRVHIRIIFVQQILNQVAAAPPSVAP
jgi:hypothetical protein